MAVSVHLLTERDEDWAQCYCRARGSALLSSNPAALSETRAFLSEPFSAKEHVPVIVSGVQVIQLLSIKATASGAGGLFHTDSHLPLPHHEGRRLLFWSKSLK